MRKTLLSICAAAVLALGMPLAASAADTTDSDGSTYAPADPSDPALAGSIVPICVEGSPWITYSLTLVDPESPSTAHEAVLTLESSTDSATITLGTITAETPLTGRVAWPGTSDAWTGTVAATADAGATLETSLSYPEPAAGCSTTAAEGDPSTGATTASVSSLPSTGGTSASTIALLSAAIGTLALGLGLVVTRRRRADSDAA
ncbi:MAG: LPXTG cell wall anchor domain-containing protein [Microbacterium sp.]